MQKISHIKSWILAARPQTFIASIAPVFLGTTLSIKNGFFHSTIFFFTLIFSLFIQIGTNFANDYFDFIKGADTSSRKGFLRATQAGLISAKNMKKGFYVIFFFAFLSSIYLIFTGGTVFFFLMILSILFGIYYTGGSRPLGYIGLGDLLVFIFFGPVATLGTFYLQTHFLNIDIWLTSLIPASLSTAILVVNNLRDYEEDIRANKKTLVVLLGKNWGKIEYLLCFLIAFFIPYVFYLQTSSIKILCIWCIFPFCLPLIKTVFFYKKEELLNTVLKKTAVFFAFYTLIFSILVL